MNLAASGGSVRAGARRRTSGLPCCMFDGDDAAAHAAYEQAARIAERAGDPGLGVFS